MRHWWIAVAAVASLLTALVVPAAAQDRQAKSDPNARLRVQYLIEPQDGDSYTLLLSENLQATAEDQATTVALEMAEDVEIMGEVLRGALTELYGPSALGACRQCHAVPLRDSCQYVLGEHDSTSSNRLAVKFVRGSSIYSDKLVRSGEKGATIQRPQGAYVYDHGVVYHAQLDVPPPEEERPKDPAQEADEDSAASRSWENAMRSLRGQPPLEPLGLKLDWGMPTKADLVNKLLDTLAENAGNWRRLGPQARITVAITFPRSKPSAAGFGAYGEAGAGFFYEERAEDYDYGTDYGVQQGGVGYRAPGYGGYDRYEEEGGYGGYDRYEKQGGYRPPGTYRRGDYGYMSGYAASDAPSSHEVSGDLHMRQQNYQKAIDAYKKAVEAAGSSKPRRDLQRKLIQAYVAAGELQKAQHLIQQTLAAEPKSENDNAAPAASHAIPLPARLTVSVTKLQLDQVASGKMTREELSQEAAVAYFNPPPGTPGLGDRKSRPESGDQRSPYRNPRGLY